jgi:flavoprotein
MVPCLINGVSKSFCICPTGSVKEGERFSVLKKEDVKHVDSLK